MGNFFAKRKATAQELMQESQRLFHPKVIRYVLLHRGGYGSGVFCQGSGHHCPVRAYGVPTQSPIHHQLLYRTLLAAGGEGTLSDARIRRIDPEKMKFLL